MSKIPSVVVVGSYAQDLAFQCTRFPLPGQTTLGTFSSGAGGKGSNQAVAAGRMGLNVAFVCAVGSDPFASVAESFYQKEGIDARWIRKPKSSTGAAAILVDERGENQIVVSLGANALLRGKDIPKGLIENAEVVVTQLESSLESTETALRRGWNAGTVTVLNPAPMRPDFNPSILRYVDVLIPNESEFAALCNLLEDTNSKQYTSDSVAQLADAALDTLCARLGVPTIVVTLGAKGAYLWQSGGGKRFPALRGVKVVDTTGAGDAFVGGFAAGLVHFEGDLAKAVRFGITVAGLSVTKSGTARSMPTKREMTAWLRRKGR